MAEISVIILTYNHEKFISQAIESVVNQKECPEFEILVADDFSSDKTPEIIKSYKEKYPDIIKPFFNKTNLGLVNNLKNMLNQAEGRYIAFVEGDDYCISEYKLKKQYDALENAPDCSLCFSNLKKYIQDEDRFEEHITPALAEQIADRITMKKFIELGNPIINFSCCMYRKSYVEKLPEEYFKDGNADFMFNSYMLDMADGVYINEPLSVYRVHGNGLWSRLSEREKQICLIDTWWGLNKIFDSKYFDVLIKRLHEILSYIYIWEFYFAKRRDGKETFV